jgi:C-terminal processing protease CtpA/Prc
MCLCLLLSSSLVSAQQKQPNVDRQLGHYTLIQVKDLLKKNYYDPTFRGLPIDTLFDKADQIIAKAESNNEIWGTIADLLLLLNDSHTRFYPPSRMFTTDYGWEMQMVGDKCYVVIIEPGTDAQEKLSVGDQVLSVGGITPTRNNLWVLNYLYDSLKPMSGKHVVVQKVSGDQVTLDVMGKVQERKLLEVSPFDSFENSEEVRLSRKYEKLHAHRFAEIGNDVLIWKMPRFDLTESQIDSKMEKAKHYKGLILDLRGNHGGYEVEHLLSHFLAQDIKIGELVRRSGTKPWIVKGMGNKAYPGKLVVMVDSASASAAEIFARVIQLEKRGSIIGDRTSGAVMGSFHYGYWPRYRISITVEEIVMADGKLLEHVGVTPDELMLPTANDLATQRDPVLSRAASTFGISIDPTKAGTVFPVEWDKVK